MEYPRKIDWKKYLITFFITVFIFVTAFSFSNNLNNRRTEDIKRIQDDIAANILSSETQFSLLSELSCKDAGVTTLSNELSSIAEKIQVSANNLGQDDQEVVFLKKYYALLEIKDYLLMRQISEKCGKKFMFALYFFDTEEKCPDCDKTGYVLTYLRLQYPQLRVYSFDRNTDVSAVKTLMSIFKIGPASPVIVIEDKNIEGYKEKEEMEAILKEVYPKETAEAMKLRETATTTEKKK